jgi:hypothetical protein
VSQKLHSEGYLAGSSPIQKRAVVFGRLGSRRAGYRLELQPFSVVHLSQSVPYQWFKHLETKILPKKSALD